MESSKSNSTVHFLPCTIEYDGPAPVKNFFQISDVQLRGETKAQAHFRGRKVIGEKVTLPADVQGVYVYSKPSTTNSLPAWSIGGNFNDLTVWEHDREPDMTFIQNTLDWFEISDAIHNT